MGKFTLLPNEALRWRLVWLINRCNPHPPTGLSCSPQPMSSPVTRRSVTRLLAAQVVQLIVLLVFFIGSGLLVVPAAAKARSLEGTNCEFFFFTNWFTLQFQLKLNNNTSERLLSELVRLPLWHIYMIFIFLTFVIYGTSQLIRLVPRQFINQRVFLGEGHELNDYSSS